MTAPSRPRYLDLKVGYTCNNRCVHCVIQDHKANLVRKAKAVDLTTEQCLDGIRKGREDGFASITLTGGEITIRPDFPKLLAACLEAGFRVAVQTNGRMFHSRKFCATLPPLKGVSFNVALHGPNAAIHDRITCRPNSFAQTVRGIERLVAAGADVFGKVVISRRNADHLVETFQLLNGLGVLGANFAFPHALGSARRFFEDVVPRYRDLRGEVDHLIREAEPLAITINFEAFPFCTLSDPAYASELGFTQWEREECAPVNEDPYDWALERRRIKAKFPQCGSCAFDPLCEGPWQEYAEAFGSEEFQPLSVDRLMDTLARAVAAERASCLEPASAGPDCRKRAGE